MDFSSLLGLLQGAGTGSAGGSTNFSTQPVGPSGYFGTTRAQPAVAISSPDNSSMATPVQAGQQGGAGMGMAPGETTAPTSTTGGGGGIGGGIADSFKAIGNAISQYGMAKAQGNQVVAATPPNFQVRPVLATFSVPTIA